MRRAVEIRVGDVLLMTALAVLALLLFILPFCERGDARTVEIVCAPEGETEICSLDVDRSYRIVSNGITLVIRVASGEVYVAESDCRDQICAHSRAISRVGQSIICAPAGVVIRVIGERGDADAISG